MVYSGECKLLILRMETLPPGMMAINLHCTSSHALQLNRCWEEVYSDSCFDAGVLDVFNFIIFNYLSINNDIL